MGSVEGTVGTLYSLEELGDINREYIINPDFDIFDNENYSDDVEAGV